MLYSMELSNNDERIIRIDKAVPENVNWRYTFSFKNVTLFILLSLILFFIPFRGVADKSSTLEAVSKLKESREQAVSSLENARKTAVEALHICEGINNDTLKTEILLHLGAIISSQGNKKEALKLFEEARDIADSVNFPGGNCRALLESGYIHYVWGEYDYSSEFFLKALHIAEKDHFRKEEAEALNYLGKYYHTRGEYSKSVDYYKRAISLIQELPGFDQEVNFYLNIGKTYISEDDIYSTLSCYLKAFQLSEKTNNKLVKADVLNHLGSIYLLLNQPLKSLEYHRKALSFRVEMKDPQAQATSYNNIGETFLRLNKLDSAGANFNKSLELCMHTGYRKGTIKALTNLGRVGNKTGNLNDAANYLKKALELSEKSGYDAGIVETTLAMGENFLLLKKIQQAVPYFQLSLSKMAEANLNEFQTEAYKGLYTCFRETGDIVKALEYLEKYAETDHRELLAENDHQLAELRVAYDMERKEVDNQRLRQENKLKQMALNQRSWIIWSVIIMLIFAVSLFFLMFNRYIQKRKLSSELQQLNEELEKANLEKDKMFSIIAHELRNPLYWFQNLTEMLSKNHLKMTPVKIEKSLAAIDESAKNAFHLMDNLLNWSRARLNRITPQKATRSLRELVDENLRMFGTIIQHKELEINVQVPANIAVFTDADMFGCILRNLISNAIKYTPASGRITIDVETREKYIVMRVCDSGVGLTREQVSKFMQKADLTSVPGLMHEKGSGLGLRLCQEFTQLIGGDIWVMNEANGGTCFAFSVPNR